MSPAEEISQRREELVRSMLECAEGTSAAISESERRQFIVGFLALLEALAGGDTGPRTQYLEAVIPGIKHAGMPLPMVLGNMLAVAMGLAAASSAENRRWFVDACVEHTSLLLATWERA
jgi:hypothetical protein